MATAAPMSAHIIGYARMSTKEQYLTASGTRSTPSVFPQTGSMSTMV